MPILSPPSGYGGIITPITFLNLVQRLALECGVSNAAQPSTVVGQVGLNGDLVNWIADAWLQLQSRHTDWSFMLLSPGVSFTTVAGKAIYTPSETGVPEGALGQWKRNTFRNFQTSVGEKSEIFMDYLEYDLWRDLYQYGALRTAQVRPFSFTITPEKSIGLQTPLAGYTITGDYYHMPIPFKDDGDVPSLPVQYAMIIVYAGMMYYGAFENAPEVYNQGKDMYYRMLAKLEYERLPEIRGSGGLA